MMRRGLLLGIAVLTLVGCGSGGQAPPIKSAGNQVAFGVNMAQRGLWSEALFRFERASEARRDFEVLNNLAVASEALGQFDQALEYYQEALALAPSDPELRNNYNRFVSFYESFRVQEEASEEESSDDSGTGEPVPPEEGSLSATGDTL